MPILDIAFWKRQDHRIRITLLNKKLMEVWREKFMELTSLGLDYLLLDLS